MSATTPPPPRRRFRYRSLPIWLQWFLPFGSAAALLVALVMYVHYETDDAPLEARVTSKAAIVEQNREDRILVEQEQAPHVVKLVTSGGSTAVAAVTTAAAAAIRSYISHEVAHGVMDGPIKGVSCKVSGAVDPHLVMNCRITASTVTYPFDAVAQEPSAGSTKLDAADTITYCQVIAPPVPSMKVAMSKRCT